jgi:alpha-galactosidase
MPIRYDAENRVFCLETQHTTYLFCAVDTEGFLGHLYYGPHISDTDVRFLLRLEEPPFCPSANNRARVDFMSCFPFEYPGCGLGDFRSPALAVQSKAGHTACSLSYQSHRIFAGKPALPGLPATFGAEDACTTLCVCCTDAALGLQVELFYTTFPKEDCIACSARITNGGQEPILLTKACSASLALPEGEYDLLTLPGAWTRERHLQRRRIGQGIQGISSCRGEPGHQANPFLALLAPDATQDAGTVYAMTLLYSGNFSAAAEQDQYGTVRMQLGLGGDFRWQLAPGESFTTPEAVLTCASHGLTEMTHHFHDLFRGHLIRSPWQNQDRPVLLNSWEAAYFDFNEEKLLRIAQKAAAMGVELFVLDDGWFGHRNSDTCSLGDWAPNLAKLPGGLRGLSDKLKALGLKFGLWMEPEMVSPDSDLYRAHPDWAIQIPGRAITEGRQQYVLDLSRPEVCEAVYASVSATLRSADITYLKWDMNRPLCDLGSAALPPAHMGELSHRYVLGLYALQERLVHDFPMLLLENCSGGGARFDAGMLYYSPQIWCSDDTDAIERLSIQAGTALVYPVSAMGAHISACPNHQLGRTTPFATRALTALAGTFGYELDPDALLPEEQAAIPNQIACYHAYAALIRDGDYYRISEPAAGRPDGWGVVSRDQNHAVFVFTQILARPNVRSYCICLRGLAPDRQYRIRGKEGVFFGDTLMQAGVRLNLTSDFSAVLLALDAAQP